MSTISDALKKAQQQRAIRDPERWTREEPARPAPVTQPVEAPEVSPAPSVVGRVLVVVVLALGVSVVMMQCGGGKGVKESGIGVQEGAGGRTTDNGLQTTDNGLRTTGGAGRATVVETGMPVVVVATPVKTVVTNRVVELPVAPGPLPPEPKLVGIFYSETNPVAIIDGLSVKEGESVGGYVVVKILPEAVMLKAGNREITLRMR